MISGTFWSKIVGGARARSIAVDIDIVQAESLFESQGGLCKLSGVPITFDYPRTASLDRIDSGKGYEIDNVQWVHTAINLMKRDFPERQFVRWCELIVAQSRANRPRQNAEIDSQPHLFN